ncbi:acyl-CoA dehydrogenase family protein [Mycolicibacterium sp. 050232]|uniref:acyl-CoA dehydrogenase family protein n=1 Tax=Mycolicibacterium sp. 050232 TaxID=3113982 RepID=UPI002E2A8274|nr:acyl-CoA dehydrogenase family protein [Mycolicibacterium sp. 050232]MED5812616.1 acyl-CoA dehydrogenase family protein [Mycolicibacterium sp. 050232]
METVELTRGTGSAEFAFTEEHTTLRDVLGDFFADANESGWRRLMSDVGADEIVFDTSALNASGASATAVDLAILAEQAGAALFGGPLLPSVAVGVLAARVGDPALVAPLREGTRTAAAAVKAHMTSDPSGGIDVTVAPVWTAGGADIAVLSGTLAGAPAVALFTDGAGTLEELDGLDLSRPLGRFIARGVQPAVLLQGEEATAAIAATARQTDLVISAELLGVAQQVLDSTVEYVDKRVQFGRTIGSFQAVKHRLVDLLAAVELTRSAVYGAAWRLTGEPQLGTDIDLAVAGLLSRQTALAVTKAAVQLHGGIAITWEHWAHRYLRRANSVVALTGSPTEYRRRLAHLIDRRDGYRA